MTVNHFRETPHHRLPRSRKEDIVVREGYRNVDEITIEISDELSIVPIPPPCNNGK